MTFPAVLVALALWQTTPSGGAIAKFVPPLPTPASFIADERSVLTPEQRRALDDRIKAVQQAGLGDIAVAILPNIGQYEPQQVAVEIYRTWKVGSVAAIGSAHRNIGVLFLIVPKELAPDKKGQCFILTGTGSEGLITDARAAAICRDSIIPYLRNKDFAGGLGAGVSAIEARMRSDSAIMAEPFVSQPAPRESNARSAPVFAILGGIAALLLAIVGSTRYARYRQRTCPRCGKRMRRLDEQDDNARLDRGQRVEEMLKSVDYDVWVCDCGESKTIPYRSWFSKYKECRECHRRTAKCNYTVLVPATTASTGLAEKRYHCQSCHAKWDEQVVIPRVTESSSSSSSGGGGGGGGSSFGGSGSTSGGGGGSSY